MRPHVPSCLRPLAPLPTQPRLVHPLVHRHVPQHSHTHAASRACPFPRHSPEPIDRVALAVPRFISMPPPHVPPLLPLPLPPPVIRPNHHASPTPPPHRYPSPAPTCARAAPCPLQPQHPATHTAHRPATTTHRPCTCSTPLSSSAAAPCEATKFGLRACAAAAPPPGNPPY